MNRSMTTWTDVEDLVRRAVETTSVSSIPRAPGVYFWFRNDECVYVGMASSLRQRLGTHLRSTVDLSRSTLRASVAVQELGITRHTARQRPSVMTAEEVEVVNRWLRGCELTWIECDSRNAADELERALRAEHLPRLNRL